MSKSELHAIVERGHELATSTRARYLKDLDVFIEYAGADPERWTAQVAEDFYTWLLDRMEPQSANRLMASVAYAAKWRAQQNRIPNFAIIRRARDNAHESYDSLTEEAAKKLLDACKGDSPLCLRDTALIVVELETGMRRASIQSMLWEKISRESQYGYPIASVLVKGRGKQRQDVPLSDTALAALEPWRAWLAVAGRAPKGPVFRSLARQRIGNKITHEAGATALHQSAIQKIMSTRAKQAGIGHLHPHMFRQTYVTWRLNAGLAPHEISVVTGHKLPGLSTISGFQQGLGAMAGYLDMRTVGEKVRSSTPEWLKERFR